MPTVLFIAPGTRTVKLGTLVTPSHGARAYTPKPTNIPAKDPDEIYMLYLSVKNGGNFRRQYWTKRGSLTADAMANDMCTRAKAGDTKYEVGQDLLDIEWKAPCYLYVVVDITGCKFEYNPTKEEFDPLHFHESKSIAGTSATFYFDRNAAFYEGVILADSVVGAPAFRCINHFTDEHEMPLWHPRLRTYGFEIRYLSAANQLDIVDPDGQNQGPPHP